MVGILLLLSCSQIQAQDKSNLKPTYKTAIGLRYYPFGVSIKANLDSRKAALEFIGYFKDGFSVLGLYEWHFALNSTRNLRAYVGGGGIVGFKNEEAGGGAVLGVSGVIGLDYKFLKMPLNLSLDWQPSYQIGKVDGMKNFGGIAVRYTL
jgi:hypothetical protein